MILVKFPSRSRPERFLEVLTGWVRNASDLNDLHFLFSFDHDDPTMAGMGDRYRGHRHDQSCASIIAHQLGMRLHPEQTYDYYYAPNMPETVEFALAGL